MSKHGSYLTSGALLLFLGFSYLITYSMYAFIHSFASLHLYLEHLADSTTFFFSKYLQEIGDSVLPCSILHCLELAIAPAQKKPHCIILLPISPTALLPSYDFSFPLDMPSFIYQGIFIHGVFFFLLLACFYFFFNLINPCQYLTA